MTISKFEFEQMQSRVSGAMALKPHTANVALESALHAQIRDYCNGRWPKWKFIEARFGCKSTIAIGCQDFTIFMPDCRMLLIECKRKGQKMSKEQMAWSKEMKMLGHEVYIVRDMKEFKQAILDETCRHHDIEFFRNNS
jgi:hypothetical protein